MAITITATTIDVGKWSIALLLPPVLMQALYCEGQVSCSCFGPGGGSPLVICGTTSGALHVWDLRERCDQALAPDAKNRDHKAITSTLRPPTYSTLGTAGVACHVSTIVAVAPVGSAGESHSFTHPHSND